MTIRYNAKPKSTFGVEPLPSGYDGNASSNSDLTIPSVGVQDVDRALFDLFDKELPLQIDGEGVAPTKVPVIFAAGEKWALLKKKQALRDRNDSLILPLITVIRTTIQQTAEDVTGRGINQQTGELVIKRRLDASDRSYQSIVNRLLIPNQQNLASKSGSTGGLSVESSRALGDLSDDPTIIDGALLASNKTNNVFEIIVLPSPQFFTSVYEVTIWTQYTQHMNQILEQLIASFLPQAQSWKIDTAKGYWFIATVDGNVYNSENNADDMSNEERLIKHKFTVKVPGYIFATNVTGAPVPIRRYVSSPVVSFNISTARIETSEKNLVDDPFLGSDDPTLPLTSGANKRSDQRDDGSTRLYPSPNTNVDDVALNSLPRGTSPAKYKKIITSDRNGKKAIRYMRVTNTNVATGETVFSSSEDLGGLVIVVVED